MAAKYFTSTFTDLATHFGSLNQREKQWVIWFKMIEKRSALTGSGSYLLALTKVGWSFSSLSLSSDALSGRSFELCSPSAMSLVSPTGFLVHWQPNKSSVEVTSEQINGKAHHIRVWQPSVRTFRVNMSLNSAAEKASWSKSVRKPCVSYSHIVLHTIFARLFLCTRLIHHLVW